MRIVTPSPTAMRGGVKAGMTLASARALLPSLLAIEGDKVADQQALLALASWAQIFGPFVCVYDEQSIAIEVSGSEHLYGDKIGMAHAAMRGLAKLGYHGDAAIATTPRAANVMAQTGVAEISLAPTHTLALDGHTLDGLASLGISTIGDLLKLPRNTLAARFGDLLPRRIAELLGDVQEELVPVGKDSSLIECMEFDPPTEDGSSLAFIMKRLVDRIAERLLGMGLGAKLLVLNLHDEERHVETIIVRAAQPMNEARGLLLLLTTKLEHLRESRRIVQVELEVTEHAPSQSRHYGLFEPKPRRDTESFTVLIDRLSARLGVNNVCRAELVEDYRPNRDWCPLPVLEGGNAAVIPITLPIRPTLLLTEPYPMAVQMLDNHPAIIDGQKVITAHGPERIACGWSDGGIKRDYWRVMLGDGRWFWLFRDEMSGQFFQHGEFV